jgi:hypothetical protein
LICRPVKGEAVEDIEMISADLVDMGILFPVCAIHHSHDTTFMKIYNSDLSLCIKPSIPELEHDGGVVIYRVYLQPDEDFDVKRMLRVLNTHDNKRNIIIAPHAPSRFHRPINGNDLRTARYDQMCKVFEEEPKLDTRVPEFLSALSMLGCADSSVSKYNSVIGTIIN